MKIVPIVFTFDANLLLPASVCISSLLMNANEGTFYDIYILHPESCDFSQSSVTLVAEKYANCRVTFREVKNEFSESYEIRGITTTAYYRLIIPRLIPEYDKVIYSDVDVIFREDLSKYYETDMRGYYFAAVDTASAIRPSIQKYVKEKLNIDHRYGYFYSGNLIINSSLILKDGLMAKFYELAEKKFLYQDMDIINIACYGRIKPLIPAFCLTNYLTEIMITRRKEFLKLFPDNVIEYSLHNGIVHYNGPKPWKEMCVNFDIWWEYYRKSPVYDERFYFDFFNNYKGVLYNISFKQRLKLLLKYFIYGRKK